MTAPPVKPGLTWRDAMYEAFNHAVNHSGAGESFAKLADWLADALREAARAGAPDGLDVAAIEAEFLVQCGYHDFGIGAGCTCPPTEFRGEMSKLINEVRRLGAIPVGGLAEEIWQRLRAIAEENRRLAQAYQQERDNALREVRLADDARRATVKAAQEGIAAANRERDETAARLDKLVEDICRYIPGGYDQDEAAETIIMRWIQDGSPRG